MNYESDKQGSREVTITGKAVGPGTLLASVESLRKVAYELEAIAAASPAVLHYADLVWKYDPGPCCDAGRGVASWTLTTRTNE